MEDGLRIVARLTMDNHESASELLQRRQRKNTREKDSLDVGKKDVPDGNNMADAARKDEEMEHGMHEFALVERIEDGAGDVTYAFSNNPNDGSRRHTVYQRLESYEHTEPHQAKTNGLQMAMVFQFAERNDGPHDGTSPLKDEKRPSPVALFAHGNERNGRI